MKIEISPPSRSIFFTGYAQLHIDSYPKFRVVKIKILALFFANIIYIVPSFITKLPIFATITVLQMFYMKIKYIFGYNIANWFNLRSAIHFVILVCSPIQCSSYYMKLLIHSLDGMNVKSRMFRPRRKKKNVK